MDEEGGTIMSTPKRLSTMFVVMTLALPGRCMRRRAAAVGSGAAGQARQGHLPDVL